MKSFQSEEAKGTATLLAWSRDENEILLISRTRTLEIYIIKGKPLDTCVIGLLGATITIAGSMY